MLSGSLRAARGTGQEESPLNSHVFVMFTAQGPQPGRGGEGGPAAGPASLEIRVARSVENIRGAGGSGSRSEARQWESAPVV